MGYYITVQSCNLHLERSKSFPGDIAYFELVGEMVKPIEYYFKWSDRFEDELVTLSKAGVSGEIEIMGEEGEYTKYVLKHGIVEVYEGTIVYPNVPNSVLGK